MALTLLPGCLQPVLASPDNALPGWPTGAALLRFPSEGKTYRFHRRAEVLRIAADISELQPRNARERLAVARQADIGPDIHQVREKAIGIEQLEGIARLEITTADTLPDAVSRAPGRRWTTRSGLAHRSAFVESIQCRKRIRSERHHRGSRAVGAVLAHRHLDVPRADDRMAGPVVRLIAERRIGQQHQRRSRTTDGHYT